MTKLLLLLLAIASLAVTGCASASGPAVASAQDRSSVFICPPGFQSRSQIEDYGSRGSCR